ncbi:rod shape-determining protein MreD [Tuanshanicoccus lijuaniae]|uniref:rod shape-determining protein MreD n=1 Tax=Aerococcaceae bacterium zg-1292 TaxID=2774330 RepID=UPI001938C086|nr:rod shape-determining protein MreD [Aerococcaceae bacterium zg-1292]MBF6625831.1 rod shape-determining protein MreD [Aerococcaceae bacterium zg-BR9]MBF6978608.1 rod shape-determining protein MreD [Aerococcaceae bacterium zg-BR22]MBS4455593.1 rod shape-determining protein MreD [Aerococcaceae bacterium zg-A91]MBS4457212.1 rod shape-determining protein MreD [Aerococcaceae bacterium zg-BR33]
MKINRDRRVKWFLPFLLFVSIIIDSALPAIFPVAFLGNNQTIVSQLALYFLTLFAFYFRDETILLNALIFGLLTDSYNTTILGIYGALYFIIAYVIIKVKKYFPKNAAVHIMLLLVASALCQFVVFVFYREFGYTTVTLTEFLATHLWPTLIFNVVLSFLMYFPSKGLLQWLGYENYIIL